MYGSKVGFALELPPWRQDDDMLYSPECAQQSYDGNMSSTSEDDSYPKSTDQDKHDVRPEDSDTDHWMQRLTRMSSGTEITVSTTSLRRHSQVWASDLLICLGN